MLGTVGHWLLVLLSALLVASAAIWAETPAGAVDMLQAIAAGAPAWSLAVPLLGLVSLAALARRRPGTYLLLLLLSFLIIAAAFAGAIGLEDAEGLGVGWGAWLAIAGGMTHGLTAGVMALGDAVPMDSPLLRLAYLGRVGHLRSLYRLAERWGWKAWGPGQPDHALRVRGRWAGRELYVESGVRHSLARSHQESYYFLRMRLRAQRGLCPFLVAHGIPGLIKEHLKSACSAKVRGPWRGQLTLYLWPSGGPHLAEEGLRRLASALEAGGRFVRKAFLVGSDSQTVVYERRGYFRITDTEQDLEELLRWLTALTDVMERYSAAADERA